MISYKPFFRTIKSKNISTYKLINDFNVRSSLIDKLRHDKPITTTTIDDLCKILDCNVGDIVEYVKE